MSDLLQFFTLSALAISCSLIGPFLVLKRLSMFANSLSHTILLGIVLAFLIGGGALFHIGTLLFGALIAALLTAFCTGSLVRFFHLQEDASIALVFSSLFALAIVLVTLFTKNVHLGIESVMGNVDLLQPSDLLFSLFLMGLNTLCVTLFFRPFTLSCFDQSLAKTLKIPYTFYHFLLLFLTSITCVGAFRAVGVLLVLAFLVGPFLTARLFSYRLQNVILLSVAIGVGASFLGVIFSRYLFEVFDLALSTGGIVTVLLGLIYASAKSFCLVQSAHAEKNRPSRKHGLNR